MENIIGIVKGLEGQFFAKDASGNVVELQNGDKILEGMTVFGADSNSNSSNIDIALVGSNEVITIAGNTEQLFDTSFGKDEIMEAALDETSLDEVLASTEAGEEEDLAILDETAAGEEQGGQTRDGQEADFKQRDGDSTDIQAGLRDAEFNGDEPVVEPRGIILDEPAATELPATEPPATEPPATEPPATEPPATEPPATEPPATEPPATEPPATEPPATEPPATEPPATEHTLSKTTTPEKVVTQTLTKTETDNKETVSLTKTETDNDTTLFEAGAYTGDGWNSSGFKSAQAAFTQDSDGYLGVRTPGGKEPIDAMNKNESIKVAIEPTGSHTITFFLKGDVTDTELVFGEDQGSDKVLLSSLTPNNDGSYTVQITSDVVVFDVNNTSSDFLVKISEVDGKTVDNISIDNSRLGATNTETTTTYTDPDNNVVADPAAAGYTLDNGVYSKEVVTSTTTTYTDPDNNVVADPAAAGYTLDNGVYSKEVVETEASVSYISSQTGETDDIPAMDLGDGKDRLTVDFLANDTIDFSDIAAKVDNAEIVDFTDGESQIINLSLDDVLDMTDSDNELEIIGDDNDTLNIDTTGWTADTDNNGDFSKGETYSNGSDSITLTVDEQIDTTVI